MLILNYFKYTFSVETPLKVDDKNIFVTPSIRPQQLSTLRTQTSNARKALQPIDKDSRKILFSTPLSTARPVLAIPTNDSISLSLEDTPGKPKSALSPINEIRSKRSTDSLFPDSPLEKPRVPEEVTLRVNNVDYVLQNKIGCGGSSSVFLAKDKKNDRECAIKVI